MPLTACILNAPLRSQRWTPAPGNALHALQHQIGCKGVRLLQVGGRMCYSTCSMNPVENEAVVAAILVGLSLSNRRLIWQALLSTPCGGRPS